MKAKKNKSVLIPIATGIACLLVILVDCGGGRETALRSKAVKLVSGRGSCSGEQIQAPSGENYILTAAHCRILEVNGSIKVIREDGKEISRRIIAEDSKSDLLLLEPLPGVKGLEIAQDASKGQHVRTFTHGRGMDTYRTEGELVMDKRVQALVDFIETKEDEARCDAGGEKLKKLAVISIFESGMACVLDVVETITTAQIVPGSSGGMVVDDSGRLVGVVSTGDGTFGGLVRLEDIKAFLSAY